MRNLWEEDTVLIFKLTYTKKTKVMNIEPNTKFCINC